MSENYKYNEVIERGIQASQLLQSPAYIAAYQSVLNQLQDRFFNTEPGHTRTLEEIRREGNALAKVQTQLNRFITEANIEIERGQQGE